MSYLGLDQKPESNNLENNASSLLVRPITVLVVDDHALIRAAISQVLKSQPEVKQVVMAHNYAEADAQVAKLHPDIIWFDLHIAGCNSIEEIHRLRRLSPTSRLMALADVQNEQEAFEAIMAAAQGYRSKQDVDPNEVMTVIHMIYHNEIVLRPTMMTRLVERLRVAAMPLWRSESGSGNHVVLREAKPSELDQLTVRERQVLQLISQGHRDRDIAEGLCISEKTVQKHVQSI